MGESTVPVGTPPEEKIIFRTNVDTIDVELPSFPKSRVTLRTRMTAQDAETIALSIPDDLGDRQVNLFLARATIARQFVSWNLTDEEGKDLTCSMDILQKFPFVDLMSMAKAISGNPIDGDVKKKPSIV